MPKLRNPYSWFVQMMSYLSIDIALGASVGVYYVAKTTQTPTSFATLAVLFLVTWLIYTADHLIDAFRVKCLASGRLLFHRKYAYPIICAWLIVAFIAIITLLCVPIAILKTGFYIALLTIIYYILRAFIKMPLYKEIGVALIYGISIAWLALPYKHHQTIVFASGYALVAILNLLLLSKFEARQDSKQHQTNGYLSVNPIFFNLLWLSIFLTTTMYWLNNFIVLLPVGAIALVHGIVMIFPEKMRKHHLYRLLTDGSFVLFPLIFS